MNQSIITTVLDNHVEWLNKLGGLLHLHDATPKEMIISTNNDWVIWKAILSTLTEKDFINVEDKLGLALPESFKLLLGYKHFVGMQMGEILFFNNTPTWADDYLQKLEEYPVDFEKENVIPFGELTDIGLACFDLRNGTELIWLDHETDFDYKHKQRLANSFEDLFRKLDRELDEWKKNYAEINNGSK